MQAGRDSTLPRRLLRYNVLLGHRHELPVFSVAVLLKREADFASLGDRFAQTLPDGREYLSFRYVVVRLWELPVDAILNGPLGMLPLAPLCDVDPERFPEIAKKIVDRLASETDLAHRENGLAATKILMTLRLDPESTELLFRKLIEMRIPFYGLEESWLYQELVRKGEIQGEIKGKIEGRIEGARRVLTRLGRDRFGPPGLEIEKALDGIHDPDLLETMAARLSSVSSWAELIATTDSTPSVNA